MEPSLPALPSSSHSSDALEEAKAPANSRDRHKPNKRIVENPFTKERIFKIQLFQVVRLLPGFFRIGFRVARLLIRGRRPGADVETSGLRTPPGSKEYE